MPASMATTSFTQSGSYIPPAEDPPLPSFASTTASHSEAWPTQDDPQLSYGGPTGVRNIEEETRDYGPPASPPLHSTDDFPLESRSSENYGQSDETETPSHEEEERDDRGWGGASPDLPPISSLRLASPPSPTADENAAGWSPEENDDFDTEPPPPPLPTVEEVFASAKPRRESVELKKAAEGGGDAWGSSQGWEERMRAEAEARAQERGNEPEPEKVEGEASGAADADAAPTRSSAEGSRPAGGLSSILGRFRKGAEDTATKSTEVAKDVADAASRTAGQLAQSASDAVAQAHDGDAKPAAAKSSWFGRKAKPADEPTPAPKKPVETKEEDLYTLGVEEVEMGGSGRASAEEPAQPSAIGRFFSRLKRAPSSNPDDDGSDKATSPRASAEIGAGSIRPDDLDVLANGGLGASRTSASVYHEDDDFRPPPARSGLFGSRSKASVAQVPQAPPEDDFGGLIGALSAAPTRPPVRQGSGSKAFDPFDPFSDSFGAVPAIPALNKPKSAPPTRAASTARAAAGRPVAPLSPPPRPASARLASQISPPRASTAVSSFRPQMSAASSVNAAAPRTAPQQSDDDFDDFFNAVTAPSASTAAVTQQRPAPQVAPRLAPTMASAARPSSSSSAAGTAAKARVAAPALRMTISPPARHSTASPASSIGSATSARPTTPILPLPPPPPPSQPIAGNSARGLNILAPPPPGAGGGGSSPSSALPSPTSLSAPASKPSLPAPLPLPRGMSSSPLAPSPTLPQGGKSLTPSATPNAQRAPSSGPLSMDDLSFFEA